MIILDNVMLLTFMLKIVKYYQIIIVCNLPFCIVLCSSIYRSNHESNFLSNVFVRKLLNSPFSINIDIQHRLTSTNYPVVLPSAMDNIKLHKYYRTSGYGLNTLIYRFLILDNDLKRLLYLNIHRGIVILLMFILAMIMAVCSTTSLDIVTSNACLFQDLLEIGRKKLPRIESVVSIIPSYKCIHKHLQQMSVFQEKIKKILCKEHLDLEIMNSKMSCIGKLLKPEIQSEWHYSRSPRIYYRFVNGLTSEK